MSLRVFIRTGLIGWVSSAGAQPVLITDFIIANRDTTVALADGTFRFYRLVTPKTP
jgi:hypothetical protein